MQRIDFNQKILPKIIKVATYIVVFWILLLLGRAIWQNWILRNSINVLQDQIVVLEQDKRDLNNLITYYQSDSFKELEARKKLNLKKPGEKVVILPAQEEEDSESFPEELNEEKEALRESPSEDQFSNLQLWWQYFTK